MRSKLVRALLVVIGLVVLTVGGLVLYVQLTYERDFGATPRPAIQASNEPEVIARGEYIAHALGHCSACHGPAESAATRRLATDLHDLRGGYAMKAGPFGTFYPANLTPDPDTGLGKVSDGDVARAIRHGVSPDGRLAPFMSFAVGPMADEDLTALVSYLRSIPPVKNPTKRDEWGFVAKALSSKFRPSEAKAPPFVREGGVSKERGAYLANGPAYCYGCHSPFDATEGFALAGERFSGSFGPEPDSTNPSYEIMAPNLMTDPETGVLAGYDEDGFVDRVRKVGRAVAGSIMPWENYARMTDDDLRSIYQYLRSIRPVRRATGPTWRPKGSFKP